MPVRLLAGPFDIVDEEGNPPTQLTPMLWYRHVGMILDTNFLSTSVCTLDGVYQTITFQRPPTLLSWWASRYRLLNGGGLTPTQEYVYEPKALARQSTGPDPLLGLWPHAYVRLEDRRVYFNTGTRRIHGVIDNVDTAEGPVFPTAFGTSYVRPGRSPTDIFVATEGRFGSDTLGCFYDTVAQVIASPIFHIGMPCDGLHYAPEFGVLVSVHAPGSPDPFQIRVWSLEMNPTHLSDVTILSGLATSGQVVTYQVQVLADLEEPCAGELVDWMVVGTGLLLEMQSTTDVDGYATTRVLYGTTESGDSTVEASVQC